jgi:hypothetical protein
MTGMPLLLRVCREEEVVIDKGSALPCVELVESEWVREWRG